MYFGRQTIKLPEGKNLIIVPVGDVQGDEQLHRIDKLVKWLVEQEKKGHLVRLILTGDYFETYSPSERVKLAGANFHETTLETIQSGVKAQAQDFCHRFKALAGKIFVVLQGHHWENIKVGGHIVSSDQYIAQQLGAVYGGDGIAVLDLLINGLPFRIMAMHGYGSGRTQGGRINKRRNMRDVVLNCNLYFMGHDNEKLVVPQEPLIVDNGEIKYLKQFFGGVGCYQESYHIGNTQAGYAEKVAYSPAVIGSVMAFVTYDKSGERPRLDYTVSL